MITIMTVNGEVHTLPIGTSVEALIRGIEGAIGAGGRFVEIPRAGSESVHLLFSPGIHVSISARPAQPANQDDDDIHHPYGSHFDDFS